MGSFDGGNRRGGNSRPFGRRRGRKVDPGIKQALEAGAAGSLRPGVVLYGSGPPRAHRRSRTGRNARLAVRLILCGEKSGDIPIEHHPFEIAHMGMEIFLANGD